MPFNVYLVDAAGNACSRKLHGGLWSLPRLDTSLVVNRCGVAKPFIGQTLRLGDTVVSPQMWLAVVCYESIVTSRVANIDVSSIINNMLDLYASPDDSVRVYLKSDFNRLNDYTSFGNRCDSVVDVIAKISGRYSVEIC